MQRLLVMVALLSMAGLPGQARSQSKPVMTEDTDNYLSHLPTDLKLKEEQPQTYRLTFDYLYLDTVGNLTRKERVTGDYTRALPDAKARWRNVRIAQAKGYADAFPEGEAQKYMEGFTYTPADSAKMFKNEFFQGFPALEIKTKNLVWDMHMIEQFSWDYFDKLELNRAYGIQSQPEDVPLAGSGTFQNRQIELTWIGVSKKNNELCALIRYQAFGNRFTTAVGNMNFQGRSHYWGEIWVSLKDKQIEYANLFEDVLVEFSLPGQSSKQIANVFRKGSFEKIEAAKR